MGETLLSLRGLSIEFVRGSDRRKILDGIDIDVARDRVLGILGESGSGMTTLAKAMVGLGERAVARYRRRGALSQSRSARPAGPARGAFEDRFHRRRSRKRL
jgi:ABC-type glutathione transport system ATPase component